MRVRRLLGAVALVALVSASTGCTALESLTARSPDGATQSSCMAALTEGVLVADEHGAIALSQPGGNPLQVIWPTGYATRDGGRRPALVDTGGRVIAHVGDRVQIGGGYTANEDGWVACDGTVVIVGG